MIVGETIFLLPFVVPRIFRPTFLKVFEINNFELGSAFSVYGMIAVGSYFFGGPIADRFSTRKLIISALVVTSIGGLFLSSIPSVQGLTIMYGFWGFSTILMFWASYVKATRHFGGPSKQGFAFGAVDGGRGLFAAILASASVLFFGSLLPQGSMSDTPEDLKSALSTIILCYSGFMILMTIPVYILLRDEQNSEEKTVTGISFKGVLEVIQKPTVWSQALIVLCAYVGFKSTDDFSLYGSVVLEFGDVNAAHVGTVSFWMRPIAAMLAGLLGDRRHFSQIVSGCFIIAIAGSLIISSGYLKDVGILAALVTIALVSAGIYGLRGIYFALFQEAKLPLALTGSAVGVVSVVGYTPDIFMGPVMGLLLDNNPGELGHQYLFILVAAFGLIGLISSLYFRRITKT